MSPVIGGLLAQGLSAEALAVFISGAAGDTAEKLGEVSMIAGDLLPRLRR